jgi:hypothetical protein
MSCHKTKSIVFPHHIMFVSFIRSKASVTSGSGTALSLPEHLRSPRVLMVAQTLVFCFSTFWLSIWIDLGDKLIQLDKIYVCVQYLNN